MVIQAATVVMMAFRDTETGPSQPQCKTSVKLKGKEIEN